MRNRHVEIGYTIRYHRELNEMTQAELAKRIGVTQKQVSRYESGKCGANINQLAKIAKVLRTNIRNLLQGVLDEY